MHSDYQQPVADYPRYHAQMNPTRVAYMDGDRACTYAELDRRTNQVANALLASGCKAGDRIAFMGLNSGPWVETFFAANKAKVVYVGVNWRLSPVELEYIFNDAGVNAVVADDRHLSTLEALQEKVPSLHTIISAAPQAFASWRNLYADKDPQLAHLPEDSILQFYTSGTTGNPKGVVITNQSMSEKRESEDRYGEWYLQSETQEVSINAMPNFHIGGLGWLLIGMYRGAKVILMPAPDPASFLDLIEQQAVSHLFAVPLVLGLMLEEQKKNPRDLSSLKVFHYGASAIAPAMLKEAIEVMGCAFCQYFGMTETNGIVTLLDPDDHKSGESGLLESCGRSVPGTELMVCDPEGNQLPPNTSGEIWVRSTAVMKEYWNMPEATAEVLQDGWYKTGDGGRIDEQGFVYLTDRIKDMVISGGENIYPSEVEIVLCEHSAVAEVAVVGIPDEKWGESLKAFVVLNSETDLTADELIEFLRPRLAGFKIPRNFDFLSELPRTASGKIQKYKLRKTT